MTLGRVFVMSVVGILSVGLFVMTGLYLEERGKSRAIPSTPIQNARVAELGEFLIKLDERLAAGVTIDDVSEARVTVGTLTRLIAAHQSTIPDAVTKLYVSLGAVHSVWDIRQDDVCGRYRISLPPFCLSKISGDLAALGIEAHGSDSSEDLVRRALPVLSERVSNAVRSLNSKNPLSDAALEAAIPPPAR